MSNSHACFSKRLVLLANVCLVLYVAISLLFGQSLHPKWLLAGMALSILLLLTSPRRILPKTLLVLGTMIISFPWMANHLATKLALDYISPRPLAAVASPGVLVRPGGQTITFRDSEARRTVTLTTCYYPTEGLAVGAAHSVDLEANRQYPSVFIAQGKAQDGSAYILGDTPLGVLIKSSDLVWPKTRAMEIAGTNDIRLAEAEVWSMVGGTFPVEIIGYSRTSDGQYLMIRCLNESDQIIPGMSGSPLVQDGRIVGFVARAFTANGTCYGEAMLAADVYSALAKLVLP